MGLKGKVAVIAGAAGGLGRALTAALAADGARLALLGRNEERLEALAAELGLAKDNYLVYGADLTDPDGLNKFASEVQQRLGRTDVLVNLVGGWTGGDTLLEVSPDEMEEMISQHLWSTFHLTRAFVPYLVEQVAGRVIVVSSPTATEPGPKSAPYAVGKAAQEALILSLASELAGSGVTANIIQVKAIDTKNRRGGPEGEKYAHWTTPEEIVAAVLYLASDEAAHLNGIRLPLYG
jgi:NAD(P)-dependent dehydrogenase (short-subunit alcohol dehydrogenase family)